MSALWRGTTPSVIRVGLGAGLHFMLLEQIKAAIMAWREPGSSSKLSALEAAAAGGTCLCFATQIYLLQDLAHAAVYGSQLWCFMFTPCRVFQGDSNSAPMPHHGRQDTYGVPSQPISQPSCDQWRHSHVQEHSTRAMDDRQTRGAERTVPRTHANDTG